MSVAHKINGPGFVIFSNLIGQQCSFKYRMQTHAGIYQGPKLIIKKPPVREMLKKSRMQENISEEAFFISPLGLQALYLNQKAHAESESF